VAYHRGDSPQIDRAALEGDATDECRSQLAAYLYPILANEGWVFKCRECREEFTRGLGCVECLEPVCIKCVRDEMHVCETADTVLSIEDEEYASKLAVRGGGRRSVRTGGRPLRPYEACGVCGAPAYEGALGLGVADHYA
jgi:hypothetical protein